MKFDNYEALKREYEKIVDSMEQTIDETYQAWKDAGCPPDSEWSIDMDIGSIRDDFAKMWEMTLIRAFEQGCPEADIDRAEAELHI